MDDLKITQTDDFKSFKKWMMECGLNDEIEILERYKSTTGQAGWITYKKFIELEKCEAMKGEEVKSYIFKQNRFTKKHQDINKELEVICKSGKKKKLCWAETNKTWIEIEKPIEKKFNSSPFFLGFIIRTIIKLISGK